MSRRAKKKGRRSDIAGQRASAHVPLAIEHLESNHPQSSDSLKIQDPSVKAKDRWMIFGICFVLAMLTWAVFGQTLKHQFVNYDDNTYVYKNSNVTRGVTLHGLSWALIHSHSDNWHPLTSISHMLDCQM